MERNAVANFIGKDGFNWWVGQVENDGGNQEDPDYTNKVKVRILGYHSPNRQELTTEDLPWSMVAMPVTAAQRSGIGSIHQLEVNSWVIGFFMDGASSQIPIVMGSIGDENPETEYESSDAETDDEEGNFPQRNAVNFKQNYHRDGTSGAPGVASTTSTDEKSGTKGKVKETPGKNGDTVTSSNKSAKAKTSSEAMNGADDKKKVSAQVGNGKCGGEPKIKLAKPIKELIKFVQGLDQNPAGDWIEKRTGKLVDLESKINVAKDRVLVKLSGLTANIKGVVMADANKFIQDKLDKLNIPNPDLDDAVKKQLKKTGGLISCLFKDLLKDLGDFIKGMLTDLLENVLDAALCLIEDFLAGLMNKLMEKITGALDMLKGVLGSLQGAQDLITNLTGRIGDFLDLFCDGQLSCAVGASSFDTGFGGKAEGNELKQKALNMLPFGNKLKLPKGGAIVGNILKSGVAAAIGGDGLKYGFNAKTGVANLLSSDAGSKMGLGAVDWFTNGPLEKFEGINFYDSDGNISSQALNCSSSNRNKKPCFPELVWDNLKSTTFMKALPIVDDIGSILGVLVKNKGSGINLTAKVHANFTCSEPEGGGATFRPIIVDGKLEAVDVLTTGIGYGFDPSETYCPKEQYVVLVPRADLIQHVEDEEYIMEVSESSPNLLQVVDTEYSEDYIALATIDPVDGPKVIPGVQLRTQSGHEFSLNFVKKFAELVIPPQAKAIYAYCGDLIPIVDNVKPINVGKGYVAPKIVIGTGDTETEIGEFSVDEQGRIVEAKLTNTVLGFIKPRIKDPKGGTGAKVTIRYNYAGPREIQEKNILPLTQYVDCVGHPMLEAEV